MRAAPFYLGAAGGLLLLLATATNSRTIAAVGAIVFLVGLVAFSVVSVQRARAEGIGAGAALGRGARNAWRFIWELLP